MARKLKKGFSLQLPFSQKAAIDYAAGLDSKVILLDGTKLAELMFEYGVSVSSVNSYETKRIDSDFFEDEEGGLPAAKGIGK